MDARFLQIGAQQRNSTDVTVRSRALSKVDPDEPDETADHPDAESEKERLGVRLLGNDVEQAQRDWCFSAGELIRIGRGVSNEIQLNHRSVSRSHAIIFFKAGEWSCGTIGRNGTFVNGKLTPMFVIEDSIVAQFSPKGPRLLLEVLTESEPTKQGADDGMSEWIRELAAGKEDAAHQLFQEYFERLVTLARNRLNPALKRMADEEDIALSVLESLCNGMGKGRFPDVSSRTNLWRLLTVMTARKVVDHVDHQSRQKRGGRMVRGESFFIDSRAETDKFGLDGFSDEGLAPEVGVQLAEEVDRLMGLLDEDLCRVAQMRIEGLSIEEIAEKTAVNARTVQRRMQEIRAIWSGALGADVDF